MHRYSRAYKDPNSPLAPLTPLSTHIFDFNINQESNSNRLTVPGSTRRTAIPGVRPKIISSTAKTRTATPRSCDSVLKKRNNYAQVIENIVPIPPARLKRSIKQEPGTSVPALKLEPPPRTKRRATMERKGVNVKQETSYNGYQNTNRLTIPNLESGHEELELVPRRQFDATKIRLASPVAPKPMSPRFGAFLARWGINCLKSIFERQEIDLQTFCCLTADDLELLGIQDPVNRERVIEAIKFVGSFKCGFMADARE